MTGPAIGDLPGLGPKSQAMLMAAGIHTVAQLRKLGSVRAYSQVRAAGGNVSLNLLWAMEGALTGLTWQVVAREHRLSLLLALETLTRELVQPPASTPRRRPAEGAAVGVGAAGLSPARSAPGRSSGSSGTAGGTRRSPRGR